MLANAKSAHRIEAIQKRALRFMLNDHESSYEDLLKKSGNPSISLRGPLHADELKFSPG